MRNRSSHFFESRSGVLEKALALFGGRTVRVSSLMDRPGGGRKTWFTKQLSKKESNGNVTRSDSGTKERNSFGENRLRESGITQMEQA